MKQSRKDFIKKAHENACSEWKTNIEKEFPELFKEDALVVGKWYKTFSGSIFKYNGNKDIENDPCGYGFGVDGGFFGISNGKYGGWGSDVTLATCKEVKEVFDKEAIKRGYKKDVVIITSRTGVKRTLTSNSFTMVGSSFCGLSSKETCLYPVILFEGKWATIVETITKEQAEKELGKTIIN